MLEKVSAGHTGYPMVGGRRKLTLFCWMKSTGTTWNVDPEKNDPSITIVYMDGASGHLANTPSKI
eukprot:SAG31_NODE_21948_length_537_cov_0.986301_1_plen_64_part_10